VKNAVFVFTLIAFLLSGCAASTSVQPSDTEQSAPPSPSLELVVESSEEEPVADNATHDAETDPDGKRIAHPNETGYFPLLAMIRDEGIYLYGINYHWMDDGMILYQNNRGTYFDWPRIGAWYPRMAYNDFDGDGANDLAVILTMGTGTGRHVEDLHILRIEEEAHRAWYAPIYTDYILSAYDVKDWMTEPITVTLLEEENMFIVNICGVSYTGNIAVWNDETRRDHIFAGVNFGDIVNFYFEGTQIRAEIAVGTLTEHHGMHTNYFGCIQADVIFDGESFRLENYTFYLYQH
jgi:hypothetical protein